MRAWEGEGGGVLYSGLRSLQESNWTSCSRLKRRPFSLERRVNESLVPSPLMYSSTVGATRTTSGLPLRLGVPSGHLSPRW